MTHALSTLELGCTSGGLELLSLCPPTPHLHSLLQPPAPRSPRAQTSGEVPEKGRASQITQQGCELSWGVLHSVPPLTVGVVGQVRSLQKSSKEMTRSDPESWAQDGTLEP